MRALLVVVITTSVAYADSQAAESAKALFEAKQHARALSVAATACDRDDAEACVAGMELLVRPESVADLGAAAIATQRAHFETALAGQCDRIAASCTALAHAVVKRDPARASTLFGRGCDGGDLDACVIVARTAPDAKARELLERACAGKVVEGCIALAERIAARDPARARQLWSDACDADNAGGCQLFAAAALRDHHRDDAARAYEHACTLDRGKDCIDAATLAADPAHGIELLRLACDNKEPESCAVLGKAIALGTHVIRDWTGGIAIVQQACELGDRSACASAKQLAAHPPDGRCADEAACKALCDQHVPRGCVAYGMRLAARAQCDDARTAYATACEGGADAVSCRRAGMFDVGCHAGDARSCRLIALGDSEQRKTLCIKHHDDEACLLDDADAQAAAVNPVLWGGADVRHEAIGDKQIEVAERACAHGVAWSCPRIAERLLHPACMWTSDDSGHSVGGCIPDATPANHALGEKLANRGCDLGNVESCKMTGRTEPTDMCGVDRQDWQ